MCGVQYSCYNLHRLKMSGSDQLTGQNERVTFVSLCSAHCIETERTGNSHSRILIPQLLFCSARPRLSAGAMIRIPRFLLSRNELTGSHFPGKDKFTSRLRTLGSRLGISTSGLDHAGNGNYSRTSASYTIFKGKAALSVSPKLPRFCKVDSGSSRVGKMGAVFLTFWPAIGTRKYDWEKKQIFALSPTEVGSLISLGPAESCEFLHDPSMKSSLEGQVKKSLSITPLSNDSGYFLNLTVMNLVQKTNERFSVPVSKAEFTVMRTALSYALPHIMGWDKAMELSTGLYPPKQQQQREVRLDPDFEWES